MFIQSSQKRLLGEPVLGRNIAGSSLTVFNEFLTVGVVGPSRQGTASDHSQGDDDHGLAQTVSTTLDDVPLNGNAVQTDHAVQFRGNEEDQRPDHTHVIGVNGGQVGIDVVRAGQHAHNVREYGTGEDNSRDQLDQPQRGVGVVNELDVSTDVTVLLVRGRETTQSAQSVDDDAQGDEANENEVQPNLFFTENGRTAGNLDQVPEQVLADLNGAREGHVAEQEETEDGAGYGLSNVDVCGPLAGALGVLERNASDDFVTGRGVCEFDLFRSRHDKLPLVNKNLGVVAG